MLYGVLGNLKLLGCGLKQALQQLGDGLVASLDRYDVYEDDGADPAVNAVIAQELLLQAAQLAERIGLCLERAQSAINRQGYRIADDDQVFGDSLEVTW